MTNKKLKSLKYREVSIVLDSANNMIKLNLLWKAIGSPKSKDPRSWIELKQSSEFIFVLEKKLNAHLTDILKITRGRGGGIWAHWQIALAYAKYLDPHLHIQVNEWARRFVEEEIDPEKGVNRTIENWKRQGKTDSWIQTRLDTKQTRHQFTSTLAKHGVSQPFNYAGCTNAINRQVLGGTAKEIKESLGIKQYKNLRDNLSRVNLAALGLAEALAEEDIEQNNLYGYQECLGSCDKSGKKVKKALT